jgi:hypothetical protein
MPAVQSEGLIKEVRDRQRPKPKLWGRRRGHARIMEDSEPICLGLDQLAQEQAPPQPPQPPLLSEVSARPLELIANVEKRALVLVPSQRGQTCFCSRLSYRPKTSNVWRQLRQENS